MLEQEQQYLKINRWYYGYTKEAFIDVLQRYPYIPFFLDDGTREEKLYRWNTKKQEIESLDLNKMLTNKWHKDEIPSQYIEDIKIFLNFIILKAALFTLYDEQNQSLEIIIKDPKVDLIPKKNKVISYTSKNRKNIPKCI